MLRFVLCGRRLEGVLRVTCRGAVGGRLCAARGGERSLVCTSQVLPDWRPARIFSTSSSPSLPDEDRLVYTGNMTKAVLGVKFFSYSTSMVSLALLPYILTKTGIGVESLVLKVAFCGVVGFFTFVTPVTLHLLSKGYVASLYHNSDKDLYTAVTYNVFLAEKRTVFSPADVEVPGVSRMFTTFYAKKKSMLLNPDLFPNPWDYHHLMGYDKPFSFDPEDLNKPSKDQ
ncbi:PREDICTED: transmembrane protein 70, mitochondrial [Nanorana parkeri]|uniref:transmembrane protein 70, mitochondrial n=1 Tax=Nanorana parkeri TaxID=125878 RepID=UPI0008547CCB|nr:PREDICTED: transmembrane protein 70, mitochondrial [Nanorana parkeri]